MSRTLPFGTYLLIALEVGYKYNETISVKQLFVTKPMLICNHVDGGKIVVIEICPVRGCYNVCFLVDHSETNKQKLSFLC